MNSILTLSFKNVQKNSKKNMEEINYDKLQYDITRNNHFTVIERPEPSKNLSTLKYCYRCLKRLCLDHIGHS